jgi:hypothetical protein
MTGCAANTEHPFKTWAEQKLDRQHCITESASNVTECMVALGYPPEQGDASPLD